jgi:tRNA threonylcarbamoyladenosine biosynthesis protein TsaB
MALILGIETATSICSVALVNDGKLIAINETTGTQQHSARLTGLIADVFNQTGFSLKQLDAIAVSMGPGSYTGLRIGVSSAKGLCYALDKPFIAVDTLKSLARIAVNECKIGGVETSNALFIPMIDARRMEVYTAVFDEDLRIIESVKPLVVDENSFETFSEKKIFYFGNGASKCTHLFEHLNNLFFIDHISLSAESVAMLAVNDFENGVFSDVAYCEPFYLKEFVAGKPRVKGLYE